ncbi:MAG: Amuc_1100 family pilus-like protein [Verrucomicrobiota bacterium]|nr:Amuc_1100 family pilus-like protein [Verrucomicrobiota bacterium]
MVWLKRNLGLVITGVVALGLLGFAGYFLYGKIKEDEIVTGELDAQTASFQELLNRPIHPGTDRVNNVELASEEHKKLEKFRDELRKHLEGPEIPTNITQKEFRALLDRSVTEMRREAELMGISLPEPDYWFTFGAQKTAVEFKELQGLAAQLGDIRTIMRILYDAKIHALIKLRRVPVAPEDVGGEFITERKAVTNNYAIVTPYEVTFQGFSSELARVMEGFCNSKQCFIVKNVGVDKAPAPPSAPSAAIAAMLNPQANRYGPAFPNRYGGPQPTVMPPPGGNRQPTGRGLQTFLDENKLRFTLQFDSVRLRPKDAPLDPLLNLNAVP